MALLSNEGQVSAHLFRQVVELVVGCPPYHHWFGKKEEFSLLLLCSISSVPTREKEGEMERENSPNLQRVRGGQRLMQPRMNKTFRGSWNFSKVASLWSNDPPQGLGVVLLQCMLAVLKRDS